jgi:hypothetical protein
MQQINEVKLTNYNIMRKFFVIALCAVACMFVFASCSTDEYDNSINSFIPEGTSEYIEPDNTGMIYLKNL